VGLRKTKYRETKGTTEKKRNIPVCTYSTEPMGKTGTFITGKMVTSGRKKPKQGRKDTEGNGKKVTFPPNKCA